VSFDTLHADALGPSITSPLLVVHDRGDAEVPWSDGARNAASASDSRLHTTLGLGHRGILRDPGVVAEVVRFVDDAADGGDRTSTLDRELFERPRRWRRLGAHAA
jgi:pimeloyl-ACP methyl ester carboxylesterase